MSRQEEQESIESILIERSIHLEKLKPRLSLSRAELVRGHSYSVIVAIPSLSISKEELSEIKGIQHYESRSLWEILAAAEKDVRVVFVTTEPICDELKKHLTSSHSKGMDILKRVEFISLESQLKRNYCELSLSENILQREDVLEKIKTAIGDDLDKAVMSTFISGKNEIKMAEKLGIPLLGIQPLHVSYGCKSVARELLTNSGIRVAQGENNLFSEKDALWAIEKIWAQKPFLKRLILKLNEGVSGMGNVVLQLPARRRFLWQRKKDLVESLEKMDFPIASMNWQKYCKRMQEIGAVVEEFIEGKTKYSPSVQAFLHPNGFVEILSTHEQILGGLGGQVYLGARFPANLEYRKLIQDNTKKIGESLLQKGVYGPFAVDYLVALPFDTLTKEYEVFAIEINLRQGGTTHPLRTTKFLTNAIYEEESGTLVDENANGVHYVVNDNIQRKELIGSKVKSLINFLEKEKVLFCKEKKRGVVLHLLGAIEDFGKFGATVIASSDEEVQKLNNEFLHALNTYICHK